MRHGGHSRNCGAHELGAFLFSSPFPPHLQGLSPCRHSPSTPAPGPHDTSNHTTPPCSGLFWLLPLSMSSVPHPLLSELLLILQVPTQTPSPPCSSAPHGNFTSLFTHIILAGVQALKIVGCVLPLQPLNTSLLSLSSHLYHACMLSPSDIASSL